MVPVAALAHAAPPPLTWLRVLTSWRVEPGVLAAVAVLGGGYGGAVYRWRRVTGRAWPRSRAWCFGCGVASIALVGLSFLGVYDDTLFWTRAVQNVTLLMVTPLLLALGAPLTLARDLAPPRWRAPLSRLLHGRPARVLTFPLVVTVVLVLPLPVLYFTPLYELTLRSPVASGLAGFVITLTGFVYFWTRFRIDPTPRQDSYAITLVITIVEMVGDAVLGVVVWLGPLIAAGFYAAVARDWGPSPRTDQTIGAGVLWVGGDLVGMPFVAIIFHRMAREDARRAAVIDAELDAAEAARTAVPAAGPDETIPEGVGVEPNAPAKLWWEDHPELSQRFRRHGDRS
jgi:cytochrome c oxidase assembly factor CtaG